MPKTYTIKLKRTNKTLQQIENNVLQYGEPLYIKNEQLVSVGDTDNVKVKNSKAVHLVPVTKTISGVTYKVATKPVFHRDNIDSSTRIGTIMDEDAFPIYPKTRMDAIFNGDTSLLDMLNNKVQIDDSSSTQYLSLGYDGEDIYVDEFTPDTTIMDPDLRAVINRKVQVDENSNASVIKMGRNSSGVYVVVEV